MHVLDLRSDYPFRNIAQFLGDERHTDRRIAETLSGIGVELLGSYHAYPHKLRDRKAPSFALIRDVLAVCASSGLIVDIIFDDETTKTLYPSERVLESAIYARGLAVSALTR